MNKIAFIVPYPIGIAPSQRFRFEQYLPYLKESDYTFQCFSFLSSKDYQRLYQSGLFLQKSASILKGFLRRVILMFQLTHYNVIFIHREASPIGPPIFEWIISEILKKKIIYDFDDAIWMKNTSQTNRLISNIKHHSKVESICKWSEMVLCGNRYLMDYAKKHNKNVAYMPTTIDTENLHNTTKTHSAKKITLGWTGTHSTIKYLYAIEDLLTKLQNQHKFDFIVISNKDPQFKKINYTYISWNKETEVKDLLKFDIGIMPLPDSEWAKGKCGFKALQYMALEIPTVISTVGVNTTIIKNGINGYLANNNEDWLENLSLLINSHKLRVQIGTKARKTVIDSYSVIANKENYLYYFNKIVAK
jgi:glycosyltransferase involved in cell wall biosynthesis